MPARARSCTALRHEFWYVVPDDAICVRTNDPRLASLADRLWERAPLAPVLPAFRGPVDFAVDVTPGDEDGLAGDPGEEHWQVGPDVVELSLGEVLEARIDCADGRLVARVSSALLGAEPALVARLLFEAPVGALLARRSYGVVHAGAITGPRGAVVVRGAPGAGKSTLVAAAHQAGLGVLADEAILVARHDPDELLAAVREVTLLPDAARLLGLEAVVTAVGSPRRVKRRLDLFASSTPARRQARRVASVVLGARAGGPARLEPLAPEAFLEEFDRGAIVQEDWGGPSANIAAHWSRHGAYRLSGASDLAGAVRLLGHLTEVPAVRGRA